MRSEVKMKANFPPPFLTFISSATVTTAVLVTELTAWLLSNTKPTTRIPDVAENSGLSASINVE